MFNKSSDYKSSDYQKSGESQAITPGPEVAPAPVRESTRSPGMPSIISADLRIVGDLHCAGDIQIEGNVEGDIKSQSVTVGEGAQVSGSLFAKTVRVSGEVKGQIEASSVTLAKSARVTGDVVHEVLSIEAGAQLEGNCRRMQGDKAAASGSKVTDLKAQREGSGSTSGAEKPAAN